MGLGNRLLRPWMWEIAQEMPLVWKNCACNTMGVGNCACKLQHYEWEIVLIT